MNSTEKAAGTSFALWRCMWLLGTFLSILIGLTLGLLGGGGSVLTMPTLLYVFGRTPREAIATSLLVVGITSLAALVPHARAGRVQWKAGFTFGAASMLGAFFAAKLSRFLPASWLLVAFGAVLFATGLAMLRGRKAPPTESVAAPMSKLWLRGVMVGSVTGLLGAGGGFLVVPALSLLAGLPMPVAVGTSLLVIAMNSFAGLAGQLSSVQVPWTLALLVSVAAVFGSLLGARLVSHVAPDRLRKGFGGFVLVMAMVVLGKELPALVGVPRGVAFLSWGVLLFSGVAVSLLQRAILRVRPG